VRSKLRVIVSPTFSVIGAALAVLATPMTVQVATNQVDIRRMCLSKVLKLQGGRQADQAASQLLQQ
jgi:hypothetical protein